MRREMLSFAIGSPWGRFVLALALALALLSQYQRNPSAALLAVVVLAAGVMQALPAVLSELGFTFDLGRARWSRLMGEAEAMLERGDIEAGRSRLQAALADATRRMGRPVLAADSAEKLAQLASREGKDAEAVPWQAEALRWREKVPGPDHPSTRQTRDRLADLLTRLGDHAAALDVLTVQLESVSRQEGSGSPAAAAVNVRMARTLTELGQDAEAGARLKEAVTALGTLNGPHHWSLVEPLLGLAELERRGGRTETAETAIRRALDNASTAGQTELSDRAREALIDLYVAERRYADAVPVSTRWLSSAGTTATDDRGAALRRLERHAEILGLAKEQEEADKYRRRAAILRASIERGSGD